MRSTKRPRRYVSQTWLTLLSPLLRYSGSRDAFVLRVVGNHVGPVLRVDRRRLKLHVLPGPDRRTRAA